MKIKIAVPREAKAGDKIRFQSPVGQTCEIVVPKGLSRGFFTGKRVITVKVPDTPSGTNVPGRVHQHKGEIQGVMVVQGMPVLPPAAPAVLSVETVNSEPVMVTGTVVGGGPSSDGKAGYGVASSSNGQAPPTYAEHVAATAQHSGNKAFSASGAQGNTQAAMVVVSGRTIEAPLPSAPPAEPTMVVGTLITPPQASASAQQAKSHNPPRVNL